MGAGSASTAPAGAQAVDIALALRKQMNGDSVAILAIVHRPRLSVELELIPSGQGPDGVLLTVVRDNCPIGVPKLDQSPRLHGSRYLS